MKNSILIVAGVLMLASLSASGAASTPVYRITDLNAVDSALQGSNAFAINNAGQVAGTGVFSGGMRPVLWDSGQLVILSDDGNGSADPRLPADPCTGAVDHAHVPARSGHRLRRHT